jgi:putative addiction module killer protein
VRAAIARMEAGNLGDTKVVGEGVVERRIDSGPGYRIYFGHDRPSLIVLLWGGTKRRQAKDIRKAKIFWGDYLKRKEK